MTGGILALVIVAAAALATGGVACLAGRLVAGGELPSLRITVRCLVFRARLMFGRGFA